MPRGVVDFFNDTGGYGFIVSDAVDEDVFFHMEDISGPDLEEGRTVDFDVEHAEKGPRAINVNRVPSSVADSSPSSDTASVEESSTAGTGDASPTAASGIAGGGPATGMMTLTVNGEEIVVTGGEVVSTDETDRSGFVDANGVDDRVSYQLDDIRASDVAVGDEVTVAVEQSGNRPHVREMLPRSEDIPLDDVSATVSVGSGSIEFTSGSDESDDMEVFESTTAMEPTDDTEAFESATSAPADDTEVFESTTPDDPTTAPEPSGSVGTGDTEAFEGAESTTPNFCPNCGTDLGAYDAPNFCPNCGTGF